MKKTLIAAFALLALSACTDTKKADEKTALNEVIKIHDKVMGNDELLMQNKMKLDTLIKTTTDTTQKAQMMAMSTKLVNADKFMENWMENFDPEQKGKQHEDIMAYMGRQKTQVTAVDKQITDAVNESTEYLKNIKTSK
jgi:hypothetical protein